MNFNFLHNSRMSSLGILLLIFIIFSLGFGSIAYRLNKAPDIFTDEIVYTRIGIRVGGEGALVWDDGKPFVVHPPLFFLAQGLYQAFTADPNTPIYAAGDIFSSVEHARLFNAFLAGLSAVLFFLIGRRIKGMALGLLLAALFLFDPFGVRINRRAMLETMAAFWILAGILLVFPSGDSRGLTLTRFALAGFVLGLSLLTKELAFFMLLVILISAFWEAVRYLRSNSYPILRTGFSRFSAFKTAIKEINGAALILLSALLTYSLYPIWAILTGNWGYFIAEKTLGIQRLLGLVQLTGWNRPGISLTSILLQRLQDYGSSYFLLALGAVALTAIAIWDHGSRRGRMLVSIGIVAYPFFGFLALFGSGNDQFFYFILVVAILLVGYTFLELPPRMLGSIQASKSLRKMTFTNWIKEIDRFHPVVQWGPAIVLLVVILPFNFVHWWIAYVNGVDNGYAQFTQFVNQNLPPIAAINASGDPIKFRYFLPSHPITEAATPQQALPLGVQYFALTPKDVYSRYGVIRPELADWIQANGQRLFAFHGDSYGDIYLYQVKQPQNISTPVDLAFKTDYFRKFAPAQGGRIAPFAWMLMLWSGVYFAALGSFSIVHGKRNQIEAGHASQPVWESHHDPETHRV